MRPRLKWIKSILLICSVVIIGFGQSSTHNVRVSGRVTDPNEAVIPRTSVTLRNLESNETSNASTNNEGVFVFEAVRPGEYELSAQTLYFDKFVRRISVEEGENSEFNIALQLRSCLDPVKRLSVEERRKSLNCEVHQERLLLGVVPIAYGLFLRPDGVRGPFPNSNLVYYGGCVADCDEKAEVLFCRSCRNAEIELGRKRTKSNM